MKCTLRTWQQILKSPDDLIVAGSNMDGQDTWTEYSIGMSSQIFFFKNKPHKFQIGDHTNLVGCSFLTTTDAYRRPNPPNRKSIVKTLEKIGIKNINIPMRQYYYTLPSYKFFISPEGNGIDCHRHYEALIAGTIPIVEDNPLIREKYKNMPVLYTKDYSEITEEYLIKKYDEMLNIEYEFYPLFLSSWSEIIQEQIKKSSNYWVSKLSGKIYYQ
jgi:hypothetical protein